MKKFLLSLIGQNDPNIFKYLLFCCLVTCGAVVIAIFFEKNLNFQASKNSFFDQKTSVKNMIK